MLVRVRMCASHRVQWFNMSEPAVREATLARSHCSVHVRFTPDMTELFSAQNMWWCVPLLYLNMQPP